MWVKLRQRIQILIVSFFSVFLCTTAGCQKRQFTVSIVATESAKLGYLSDAESRTAAISAVSKISALPENELEAVFDGRTKSPDNVIDEYLARNSVDSKKGTVVVKENTNSRWIVNIELQNDKISIRVGRPK
jgi:hypothetical protein